MHIIFSTTLVALLSFSQVAAADPIRLGYLLDLSAKGAFMGQQSQAGALLAQRELAARGIAVEIIFEDHRTEGKSGASGARKLLDQDNVDALLCDLTPPCVAASPIAYAAGRIFFYQAPVDSIRAANPIAFRNFLDYEEGCFQVANYWKRQGLTKLGHLKINAEFGELCLRGSERAGISQEVIEYDPGTELRSIITRLKRADVGAILQTGYEGDYINQLRASVDLGLLVPMGLPQPLLTETVINSVPSHVLDETVVFGFPPLDSQFIQLLKNEKLYRSAVAIESAAIAYTHVIQVVEAIQKCGKSEHSCMVRSIERASPGLLGFEEWNDRAAVYSPRIRRFINGNFKEIGATQ